MIKLDLRPTNYWLEYNLANGEKKQITLDTSSNLSLIEKIQSFENFRISTLVLGILSAGLVIAFVFSALYVPLTQQPSWKYIFIYIGGVSSVLAIALTVIFNLISQKKHLEIQRELWNNA